MFAIEGLAATGYLTYLGTQFQQDRSNDNARKIFKCSLWCVRACVFVCMHVGARVHLPTPLPPETHTYRYLPLMLALFVFHRKFESMEDDAGDEGVQKSGGVAGALEPVKTFFRSLCMHEFMTNSGSVCPSVDAVKKPTQASETN